MFFFFLSLLLFCALEREKNASSVHAIHNQRIHFTYHAYIRNTEKRERDLKRFLKMRSVATIQTPGGVLVSSSSMRSSFRYRDVVRGFQNRRRKSQNWTRRTFTPKSPSSKSNGILVAVSCRSSSSSMTFTTKEEEKRQRLSFSNARKTIFGRRRTRRIVARKGWLENLFGGGGENETEEDEKGENDDENAEKTTSTSTKESADDTEFSKKNSKEEEKEIESLKPIKVPMMNLDVSTTLADLELLLGPDEKKLEEERKEKEEEAKYLKLKETREMKQKSMDESSSDNDMSLDERTRRIREENRKKFRVDLSKESSGGDGLVDLLKPPSSDDDEVKSEEKGKEEGGSKSIDSSNNNVVSSRDEKLEKVLADLGKIAQRKKMKEEGKMASSDEDDEAELQREERELQKQFDALLDILEEPGIPPVSKEDVDVIKNEIFGMQTFFVTSVETIGGDLDDVEAGPGDNAAAATSSGGRRRNFSMGQGGTGALFRGNLRKDRQEVWDEVRAKLYDMFDNKYEIFMLEEPDALSPNSPGPGESVSNTRGPRVSFLVVPADRAGPSEETGFWQYLIALALIGFTVGSAVQLGLVAEVSRLPEETMRWLAEGGGAAGIDPSIDPSAPPPGLENFDTVAYVEAALPVTAGVLLSSLAHEVGHRVVGAMRNVKLSIPYLIPNGQLGTFGTITQIKSIPENRSDFFDVAIAGPLCGGVTALALFSYGLVLSIGHDPACVPIPGNLFGSSLLLGGVSELLLTMGDGDATATGAAAATSAIVVHPYFIAGW